jgi:hypothetical protein
MRIKRFCESFRFRMSDLRMKMDAGDSSVSITITRG